MTIIQTRKIGPTRKLLSLFTLSVFVLSSMRAEDVYVSSFVGATQTGCPPSCAVTGTSTTTTTVSSAPGVPTRSRALIGVVNTEYWHVTPTLAQSVGVYKIYITKGTSGNGSPNLVVAMTASGGDLADVGGTGAASINLTNFNSFSANNVWVHIGYITNNTTTPTINFDYVSGTTAATGGRWYMDVVRFEYLDPCTGVAPLAEVTGPVAAGQTSVDVVGVAAGATNVTVYANGSPIGSTNFAGGFAAGTVSVPTSPLVISNFLTATQIKVNALGGACFSQQATSGTLVGGGANPKIKVSLGLLQNAALTGPVGANTTGTGTTYWLKATGLTGGSATAPVGGAELIPGACWQLVTFRWGVDNGLLWQTGGGINDANPYAAFEHLAIAIDDADSGPYDIYIDSIKNGNTVIEDFESYANDTVATFVAPNVATVPNPGPTYLSAPNSSAVSSAYAFDGTKSCRVRWQFKDVANTRWVRLLAGSSIGKKYPQLDTHQPVTVRILVLPVGSTTAHAFTGVVSDVTNSGPAYVSGTNTLGVPVSGPGPYTYQWTWSGGSLPNPSTNQTYLIDGLGAGVTAADNGTYTIAVSDGTCTETRSIAFTAADPLPIITGQPAAKTITNIGGSMTLSVVATAPAPAGFPLTYQWRFNGNDLIDATDATITSNNLQVLDAGYYDVLVGNSFGSVTSSVATLDVVQPGVLVGAGTGLRGVYWTSAFSTNPFAGNPTLNRVDPTVNFNFGGGSPDPSISADHFTARWFGKVRALDTDTYTFYTTTDDGVRLWVDGQLVINSWILQAPTEHSGTIALTANTQYDLLMEYYENLVGAVATLSWSGAGGGVVKEIIPMSQLFPGTSLPSPSLSFYQQDPTTLVFNWGPGTYVLTSSTNVNGPYTDLSAATSPYSVTIGSDPQKYFRLRVQ